MAVTVDLYYGISSTSIVEAVAELDDIECVCISNILKLSSHWVIRTCL